MITIDDHMKKILALYLISCFILYKMKPDMMFDKQGKFKQFGVGKEKTIAPFWLVTLLIGISGYLFIRVQSDKFVDN
jgi:hypothetical protein